MYGIALIIWCLIAIVSARALSRLVSSRWLRTATFVLLVPVIVLAPVADEIIGKLEFDRLCDDAREIEVFSTLPAAQELYLPDGRWRLSSPPPPNEAERRRIDSLVSVLRYESTDQQVIGAFIPITKSEHRVYDRRTDQLLASFLSYHTRGGWLNRWGSEKPGIVRAQCFPEGYAAQRIMPFNSKG